MQLSKLMLLTISVIIGLCLAACSSYQDGDYNASAALPNGVVVTDVAADRPEFKREYVADAGRGVKIKITAQNTFLGGVSYDGELDQPSGSWVLFEPSNPADKVLDREILPRVQALCASVLAVDANFRANSPRSFVDDAGVKWTRQ